MSVRLVGNFNRVVRNSIFAAYFINNRDKLDMGRERKNTYTEHFKDANIMKK